MIRRHSYVFRLILMAADVVMALAIVTIAARLRFGSGSVDGIEVPALPSPEFSVGLFVAVWIGLLWSHGLYRSRARWTITGELVDVLQATGFLIAITLSSLYLFKLADVSRLMLIFVFPSMATGAFAIRIVMRMTLIFLRDSGRNVRYMLILGANARAKAFAEMVEAHKELGLVVIGYLQADAKDNGVVLDRPLLGTIDQLETVLHSRIVDEVGICLPFSMEETIEQAALLCQKEGKVVRIPVAPVERVLTHGHLESIDGVGVYLFTSGPDRVLSLLVKRCVDLAGAAVLLTLLSPFFLILAVLIKMDSPGPVFFRQKRVGLHGRVFPMVKFRSMVQDAETQVSALRHRNEIQGQAFKVADDPRRTRLGCFLRRSSLDELPQLWNVLRGQMSMVGPRPPLPDEVAAYDVWHRRRLSMKPGMTGLWQIGARSEPEFDRWVEKDLEYIDTWSLWLDFKIMARTVPAMLLGEGR